MIVRACFLSLVLAGLASAPATVTQAAESVTFRLQETLTIEEAEVGYALDLALTAQGPTRIAADAHVDLREVQAHVPEMMVGTALLDLCGFVAIIDELALVADGTQLGLDGRLDANFYFCQNLGGGAFQRGDPRYDFTADVRANTTVKIEDNCFVLVLGDLALIPNRDFEKIDEDSENLEAARLHLVQALALILEEAPICPKLPPELAALDPIYDEVSPSEIGDGGVGMHFRGSIDVRPSTILDILKVLQSEGLIPGPP